MKITVMTLADKTFVLDVSEDLELENFKAFCEVETGIPARDQVIMFEGRPLLEDKKTLAQLNVREHDILLVQHIHGSMGNSPAAGASPTPAVILPPELMSRVSQNAAGTSDVPFIDFGSIAVPSTSRGRGLPPRTAAASPPGSPHFDEDPEYLRQMLLANPDQLGLLKSSNPRLADALLSSDKNLFRTVLQEQMKEREERERMRIRMLAANPFDLEAQRLIAEEIRLRNIERNMEAAIEHHPESFGQVVMLYINCRVNGYPVKAFIDSGAQTTIMSQECAERCHIMRLVDSRWAGVAKGVGVQKIIGRVHLSQIEIEGSYFTSSFSILENQPMDMLLGLDMLRRHQCVIDLKHNWLLIGTTGTKTPFLSEKDLPENAREASGFGISKHFQESDDKALAEALQKSEEDMQQDSPKK